MRGRSPVGVDASHLLGSRAGQEQVPLITQNLPLHTHAVQARNSAGNSASPTNGVWAQSPAGNQLYSSSGATTAMAAGSVGSTGSGQAVQVMQPYAVLNCIIAITGYYPTRP
jgi:microcystin-dependent protein